MGKNAVIFLHPTLRNLTISCFDVGEDIIPYISANQSPTGLRSLTFDECNITVKGLAAILSLPKGLQRLTIGERMHHLHGYAHTPLGPNPESFLQALALQKDSLQYLKHIGVPCGVVGSIDNLSMDVFTNLREMELDNHSILASILSEAATRGSPFAGNLHLRLIQAYNSAHSPPGTPLDEDPLLGSMYQWFKLVPNLDFIIDFLHRRDGSAILTGMWKHEKQRKFAKKIFALAATDVTQTQNTPNKRRLKMFFVQSAGYIPPYMYGEIRPRECLIFDSQNRTA